MDSIIRLGTFCIRDRSSEKATAVVSPPSGVPVVLKRTLTRPHRYILFSADIALWSMYATRAANSKQHRPGQVWRVYSQQTSEGRCGSQYHTEGRTDQTIFFISIILRLRRSIIERVSRWFQWFSGFKTLFVRQSRLV